MSGARSFDFPWVDFTRQVCIIQRNRQICLVGEPVPPVAVAVPKPRISAGPHLSPNASFNLLASITLAFLAGSSAPTPLYALYQSLWGLSPVMITVVFGVYALAVLTGLLLAGRLSDHVGRRPVLIAATLAQAMTMLLFATAASAAGGAGPHYPGPHYGSGAVRGRRGHDRLE